MRAWQVERHGDPASAMRLVERDTPRPGPGQLRMRVRAAAVGLPDALLCAGSYALSPTLPFTPGQELVGDVLEVGAGTHHVVGQRLMAVSGFMIGSGSFAEECLALDEFALPVPPDMTDEEAAGFSIGYHTAHVALVHRAALRAGETLLVLGASGGTGSCAVQLGKALGARVIAVAGGSDKVAFCAALGADDTIDHRECDFAGAVHELTAGAGADVVFDPVGGDAFTSASRCIARDGRLLAIGFASGRWGEPSIPHLVVNSYSIVGVLPGMYGRDHTRAVHADLIEHWHAGRIRVPVHRVVPFADLPASVAEVARRQVLGRIVVEVANDSGERAGAAVV